MRLSTASTVSSSAGTVPSRGAMRGRTNSWGAMAAETGEPGMPRTGFTAPEAARQAPMTVGFPGKMATPWTKSSPSRWTMVEV